MGEMPTQADMAAYWEAQATGLARIVERLDEQVAALTTERDKLRGEVDALQDALDDLREEAWTRGERDG